MVIYSYLGMLIIGYFAIDAMKINVIFALILWIFWMIFGVLIIAFICWITLTIKNILFSTIETLNYLFNKISNIVLIISEAIGKKTSKSINKIKLIVSRIKMYKLCAYFISFFVVIASYLIISNINEQNISSDFAKFTRVTHKKRLPTIKHVCQETPKNVQAQSLKKQDTSGDSHTKSKPADLSALPQPTLHRVQPSTKTSPKPVGNDEDDIYAQEDIYAQMDRENAEAGFG